MEEDDSESLAILINNIEPWEINAKRKIKGKKIQEKSDR